MSRRTQHARKTYADQRLSGPALHFLYQLCRRLLLKSQLLDSVLAGFCLLLTEQHYGRGCPDLTIG